MKRGAIAVVAAVALLLPTSVAGAPFRPYYSGQIGDGSDDAWVEFHAKFHSKRAFEKGKPPSKVFAFHWFNVPVLGTTQACFDSMADNGFDMRVSDAGKVHGTFEVPDTDHRGTVRRGKFKHQNKKVTGRLRVKGGHFSDGCAPAASGIEFWFAHYRAGRDLAAVGGEGSRRASLTVPSLVSIEDWEITGPPDPWAVTAHGSIEVPTVRKCLADREVKLYFKRRGHPKKLRAVVHSNKHGEWRVHGKAKFRPDRFSVRVARSRIQRHHHPTVCASARAAIPLDWPGPPLGH